MLWQTEDIKKYRILTFLGHVTLTLDILKKLMVWEGLPKTCVYWYQVWSKSVQQFRLYGMQWMDGRTDSPSVRLSVCPSVRLRTP